MTTPRRGVCGTCVTLCTDKVCDSQLKAIPTYPHIHTNTQQQQQQQQQQQYLCMKVMIMLMAVQYNMGVLAQ